MVIVQVDDSRNKEWAKSSIGSKLLKNMGWTEGEGLGRRQQGSSIALRAVRMEENRGIGAKDDDITGSEGWSKTADGFASVLSSLQPVGEAKKKKKKKKLVLAKNKVTAGHSRKMREAKDLTTKSESDMAAIFGGKVETKKKKKRKRASPDRTESPNPTDTNAPAESDDKGEKQEILDVSDENRPKKKSKKEKKAKKEKKSKKKDKK